MQSFFGNGGSVNGVKGLISVDETFKEDIPDLVISVSKWHYAFTGDYLTGGDKRTIFNHLDKYIGSMATITQWDGDRGFWGNWAAADNFALKFTYNIVNNAYITAQIFDLGLLERPQWRNPLGGNYGNLDGSANYQQADALVNTAATLAPYARGTLAAKSTLPEGIVLFKQFNFTSDTKGAAAYNLLNKGINYLNKDIGTGMKTLPFVKSVVGMVQPDNNVRKWMKKNVGYRPQFN